MADRERGGCALDWSLALEAGQGATALSSSSVAGWAAVQLGGSKSLSRSSLILALLARAKSRLASARSRCQDWSDVLLLLLLLLLLL